MTSGLSLKLYLNSLVYHRNIFGSSSEVFGNLRKCWDIFGNFRKFSENVRQRSSGIRNNFGKSSEIFGKSSKTPSSARLYNKKNITRRLWRCEFYFLVAKTIFYSLAALVRKMFCHSKIKFISSRHRVISSIYCLSKRQLVSHNAISREQALWLFPIWRPRCGLPVWTRLLKLYRRQLVVSHLQ